VTVVLNHWRRPAENLRRQLRAVVAGWAQEVWVCILGSPYSGEYQSAVDSVRTELEGETESVGAAAKIRVVLSDADLGVFGRFYLASLARTRFVYIVDDDVVFPVGAVEQYLGHMARQPGVWGHAGHTRSVDPKRARWVDRPRRPTLVDYANAGWFIETAWIGRAFLRESPQSRLTGEDMHLSYMVKKTLGLETRVVGWRRDMHPLSRYQLGMTDMTTLTPSIFAFRSFVARAQLARGPIMTSRLPLLDALIYVDTADQAAHVIHELERCNSAGTHVESVQSTRVQGLLCTARRVALRQAGAFRTALAISGLQNEEERSLIEAAAWVVCHKLSSPSCAFTPYEVCGDVCEEMRFARISFFDLGVGGGQGGVGQTATRAYLAADALEAAAGLLGSLEGLAHLFLPLEDSLVRRMFLQAAQFHVEQSEHEEEGTTVDAGRRWPHLEVQELSPLME